MEVSAIPGFYTVQEAAEIIGVGHSQVTRYIADGLIKEESIRRLGQQMLIEQRVVHEFKRPPRGNPAFRKHSVS